MALHWERNRWVDSKYLNILSKNIHEVIMKRNGIRIINSIWLEPCCLFVLKKGLVLQTLSKWVNTQFCLLRIGVAATRTAWNGSATNDLAESPEWPICTAHGRVQITGTAGHWYWKPFLGLTHTRVWFVWFLDLICIISLSYCVMFPTFANAQSRVF